MTGTMTPSFYPQSGNITMTNSLLTNNQMLGVVVYAAITIFLVAWGIRLMGDSDD